MKLPCRQRDKTGSSRTRSFSAAPTSVCTNESMTSSHRASSFRSCASASTTRAWRGSSSRPRSTIELTSEEYEEARSDDEHFVIAPGHPHLDGERIVEEADRFLIVTKEDVD